MIEERLGAFIDGDHRSRANRQRESEREGKRESDRFDMLRAKSCFTLSLLVYRVKVAKCIKLHTMGKHNILYVILNGYNKISCLYKGRIFTNILSYNVYMVCYSSL